MVAVHAAIGGMKRQIWGTAILTDGFSAWGGNNVSVLFDSALPTNNYSVQVILSDSMNKEYWTLLRTMLIGKYQSGFVLYVFNDSEHTINAGVKYEWLVTY